MLTKDTSANRSAPLTTIFDRPSGSDSALTISAMQPTVPGEVPHLDLWQYRTSLAKNSKTREMGANSLVFQWQRRNH